MNFSSYKYWIKSFFAVHIDPKRIYGLDILRASAILFVVIEHGSYVLPPRLRRLVSFLVFDGVSIFFVLSGFLIGSILIKMINTNGLSREILLKFWIRRWFRTLPNYFLILLILCLLNLFFTDNFTFRSVTHYFVFMQNLYEGHPAFFPEAWSISVEEWFYLITPLFIAFATFLLKTTYKRSVIFTAILLILAVTLFRYLRHRIVLIDTIADWDWIFRKQVVTRLDSLMFGVLGAYLSFYYFEVWLYYKNLCLFFGLFLLAFIKIIIPNFVHISSIYYSVFSFSLISISVLLLLPFLSDIKTGKGILYQLVTRVSLISYSMYLTNLSLVQLWIINKLPWTYLTDNEYITIVLKYSFYWGFLFFISVILYKYVEIPVMNFRESVMINKLLFTKVWKKQRIVIP